MAEDEKQVIEHEIERARDNIGDGIDALDRKLRRSLDFETYATEHAPQILAGGAVLGFLVGFGFPKPLRRVLTLGVPLAVVAYKVKQSLNQDGNGHFGTDEV